MEQTIPNVLLFINAGKKLPPGIAVLDFSKASFLLSVGSADDGFNQILRWISMAYCLAQTAACNGDCFFSPIPNLIRFCILSDSWNGYRFYFSGLRLLLVPEHFN